MGLTQIGPYVALPTAKMDVSMLFRMPFAKLHELIRQALRFLHLRIPNINVESIVGVRTVLRDVTVLLVLPTAVFDDPLYLLEFTARIRKWTQFAIHLRGVKLQLGQKSTGFNCFPNIRVQ